MSSKKDMRRPDLAIPYVEPKAAKSENDFSGTMAQMMPMMAMFLRNKMIGWTAFVLALQNWLTESPNKSAEKGQPAILTVLMSFASLAVVYMPLFLPPGKLGVGGTGTEAPPPQPPK